jgi:hypothetical protein
MQTSIHFRHGRWCAALCLAGLAAGGGAAPTSVGEFSADVVKRDASGRVVGGAAKIYVANRKVRLETSEASAGFFLIDGEAGTALFVQPAQRVYMDAKQSTRLTQLFVPVDVNNPCPQWQTAAKNAGTADAGGTWHCARAESASANPDGNVAYRLFSQGEQLNIRWVDAELGLLMKLEAADGTTIALEHIRIEAQPATLFALPPDFHKSDPQALLERIKRSDVWVGQ